MKNSTQNREHSNESGKNDVSKINGVETILEWQLEAIPFGKINDNQSYATNDYARRGKNLILCHEHSASV